MAITGFDNTYQKMMNSREIQTQKSLILMSLLSENAVATFPHWLERSATWYPNGPQIGARECSETRKLVNMRLKNITQQKYKKKHSDLCKHGPKSGSQKSDCFVVFQGSIPAWSLGRPWGGCRAQKHIKMEVQIGIFCYLRTLFSLPLETLWKYVRVFHEW